MSNKELKFISICKKLSLISDSDWLAIRFEKEIPASNIKHVRFCEAVYKARRTRISLFFGDICCEGAKRCFGWLKNSDAKLARRLAEKIGMTQDVSLQLIKSVPVLNEEFSGISLGKDIDGDVYISYINPESAMKLIRCWQKITGNNLKTEISGIMSVCGNVAVKSYLNKNISISFGCPDSREYGSIEKGQLVIGIPRNIVMRLYEYNVNNQL